MTMCDHFDQRTSFRVSTDVQLFHLLRISQAPHLKAHTFMLAVGFFLVRDYWQCPQCVNSYSSEYESIYLQLKVYTSFDQMSPQV